MNYQSTAPTAPTAPVASSQAVQSAAPTWRPHRIALATAAVAAILVALLAAPVLAQDAAGLLNDDPTLDPGDPQGNFPTPALVSPSWKLQFTHDTPDTLAVTVDGRIRWYWYMPFSVTNRTADPVYFVGRLTLLTDGGRVMTTNRAIPDEVFNAVKERLGNPLLLRLNQTAGSMLPGPDSQRDSVAIWPVPVEDVDRFTLFVAGIYGEVAQVPNPVTGEPLTRPITNPLTGEPELDPQGNPRTEPVLVQRTLRLDYFSPGTPRRPQQVPITLTQKQDVMR
ncbi:MAG: hypothetical protein AAF797_13825 [Planctomycetota bacterium]